MFNKVNFWVALCVAGLTIPALFTACGDLEDCTAPEAGVCECTDESGAQCDDGTAEGCTCVEVEGGTTTPTSNTSNPGTSNSNTSNTTPATGAYRYVILEDETDPVAGDFPGADVDAISITDASSAEFFATTVEDFNIGALALNQATDTNQLLGPNDANCEANSGKFTALGGGADDSYVIVGFSTPDTDVTFDSGTVITIYELGNTLCGQFDDDPYTVSVSASDDRGNAVLVGTQSQGTNSFTVP